MADASTHHSPRFDPGDLMRTRKPGSQPAVPAEQAAEQNTAAPDDITEAESLHAEVGRLQAKVEAARAEAEVTVTTARAQAARLVAEAEQHARRLTADAFTAEREAARLDERAGYLDDAENLRVQAADYDEQAEALTDETASLTEQADALTARLADLGVQRENAAARLTAAREAGDVPEVSKARTEMAAVDEVTAVLTGQRDALRARLTAIGEPGGIGELPDALGKAATARAKRRRVLNILDPDRFEAQLDRVVDSLTTVAYQTIAESAPQRPARRQVIHHDVRV
jgi:hypothetical protein